MAPLPPSSLGIWTDTVSSLVIVVASLLIFRRTNRLYRLSGHAGIGRFRCAFLFFAITFAVQLARPILWWLDVDRSSPLHALSHLIGAYAGTMAVLSLLYSVLGKRIAPDATHTWLWLNVAAVLFAALTLVARLRLLALLLHAAIFIAAIVFSYLDARKNRRRFGLGRLYLLYALLFAAWMANIAAGFAARFSFMVAGALSAASAILFLILLAKVWRRTAAAA